MGPVLAGRKPENETLCFSVNLVCAAVAVWIVSSANRFSLGVLQRAVAHACVILCACRLFGCRSQCNGCMIVLTCSAATCAQIHSDLPRDATKRIVMASRMLHGTCLGGEKAGERNLVFFREPRACGGCGWIVSSTNRFSLGVLQRAVAHVCVILCACRLFGCRSQCNGCMIVLTCSDATCAQIHAGLPRDATKRIVMASRMLHGTCLGGEKAGERNLVFFREPRVCCGCGLDRFKRESVLPWCSATCGCSCVRNSMCL